MSPDVYGQQDIRRLHTPLYWRGWVGQKKSRDRQRQRRRSHSRRPKARISQTSLSHAVTGGTPKGKGGRAASHCRLAPRDLDPRGWGSGPCDLEETLAKVHASHRPLTWVGYAAGAHSRTQCTLEALPAVGGTVNPIAAPASLAASHAPRRSSSPAKHRRLDRRGGDSSGSAPSK